jgi:proteasome maturation protein
MHQEPSLRIVPAKAPVKASISDTANSLGLHDTLKYGPRSLADEIKSNPLQARLENVRHAMRCIIISLNRGRVTTVG